MRDLQNARFVQRFAEQLQPDRQAMSIDLGETAWHADSANSRQVSCDSENISEIHLQRIRDTFT